MESLCTVQKDLQSLEFEHREGYVAQETFRVRVQVKNPVFVSTRNVKVFVTSKRDGRTVEKGVKLNTFSVAALRVYAGQKKFLWGIEENEPVEVQEGQPNNSPGIVPFKLFKQ